MEVRWWDVILSAILNFIFLISRLFITSHFFSDRIIFVWVVEVPVFISHWNDLFECYSQSFWEDIKISNLFLAKNFTWTFPLTKKWWLGFFVEETCSPGTSSFISWKIIFQIFFLALLKIYTKKNFHHFWKPQLLRRKLYG